LIVVECSWLGNIAQTPFNSRSFPSGRWLDYAPQRHEPFALQLDCCDHARLSVPRH